MDGFSRLKSNRRKSVRKKVIKIAITVVASFVLIALILIPFFNKKADTERIYAEAMTLIEEESYADAYGRLEGIAGSDYKDTTSLLYLCSSHMLYENGEVAAAFKELKKVNFSNQTEEQMATIEEYRDMLKKEYDLYMEEQADSEPVEENSAGGEDLVNDKTSGVKAPEDELYESVAESFVAEDYSEDYGDMKKENENENN